MARSWTVHSYSVSGGILMGGGTTKIPVPDCLHHDKLDV